MQTGTLQLNVSLIGEQIETPGRTNKQTNKKGTIFERKLILHAGRVGIYTDNC